MGSGTPCRNCGDQNIHDPGGCFAIPILRDSSLGTSLQLTPHRLLDSHFGRTRDDVRATGNSHGPFRVVADGGARNAEAGGLFLNASRIGHDQGRMPHQAEEIQIPERFQDVNVARTNAPVGSVAGVKQVLQPEFGDALSGPGMNREKNGTGRREFLQPFQYGEQCLAIVHIGRSMQGE